MSDAPARPSKSSLVLASASPRRREILETLGIPFEVAPSDVDERRADGEGPEAYVRRLSREKAEAVARRFAGEGVDAERFVLGADTTVVVDDRVLEKPGDDPSAAAMIAALAGRTHRVITGVTLASTRRSGLETIAVTTEVRFRALDEDEIAAYVASGEGRDKAGAYAVQGLGSGLVEAVSGCYQNVVGLPAAETVLLLRRHGAIERWP